jgi:hypothetical protein
LRSIKLIAFLHGDNDRGLLFIYESNEALITAVYKRPGCWIGEGEVAEVQIDKNENGKGKQRRNQRTKRERRNKNQNNKQKSDVSFIDSKILSSAGSSADDSQKRPTPVRRTLSLPFHALLQFAISPVLPLPVHSVWGTESTTRFTISLAIADADGATHKSADVGWLRNPVQGIVFSPHKGEVRLRPLRC